MYVGLDLHKATINAAVMNENGTVLFFVVGWDDYFAFVIWCFYRYF
jgi:hypothetical protein